jgi:hypothetical protein
MTTRREFLQAGIAVSALPIGTTIRAQSRSGASTSPMVPEPLPLYKVVFDERVPDSVAFADEMRRRGAVLQAIRGDITDFWYRELYAVWQQAPVAIAGLTAHGPMFCLEQLARDYRMRVVFLAEHQYRADACVEHSVSASEPVMRHAASLADAGTDWSTHVARLIHSCAPGRRQPAQTLVTSAAHGAPAGQDPLFSWVIAPRT